MAKETAESKSKTKEKEETSTVKEVVTEKKTAKKQEETQAKPTAKAGKRSAKSLKEVEEKQAKEARKVATKETEVQKTKPKQTHKPPKSRLERRGKKYREAAKLIDTNKEYGLGEALKIIGKTNPVKFDASVELHIRLNVDPRQADQNVRDSVILPAGSGKTVKVAVLIDDAQADNAKKAGADLVGTDKIFALLDKEKIDFDVLISTPANMAKLGKYAKLLGPRGLMPNPKSGTVTQDVAKAVTEAKGGKVEYRVDSGGILHIHTGKTSFTPAQLQQNCEAVLTSVKQAKPASVKGTFVRSLYLTTTMGPSLKLSTSGL